MDNNKNENNNDNALNIFPSEVSESRLTESKIEDPINEAPKEEVEEKTETSQPKRPEMWTQRKTYTPPPKKDETSNKYVFYTILLAILIVASIYFIFFTDLFKKKEQVEETYDSTVIPKFKLLKEEEYDTSAKNSYFDELPTIESDNWDINITYKIPEGFQEDTLTPNNYYYSKGTDVYCYIKAGKLDKTDILTKSELDKIKISAYAYSMAKSESVLDTFGKANINNIDWYVIKKDVGSYLEYDHVAEIKDDFYYITYTDYQDKNYQKTCEEGYQFFIKSFIQK